MPTPASQTRLPPLDPTQARTGYAYITLIEPPLAADPPVTPADAPLAGKRLAVKDNIDVAGVPTTCACPDYAYTPAHHADAVARLLEAGAVVVGKTNLDQFACGLNGTRSPWGAVANAFDVRHVSGGSSSGSAVAVALGEADLAFGTDTAGSGRVPAAFNNLVGFKPTVGAVSTRGVVPASASFDCVSVFAPTVADAWDAMCALYDADARLDARPLPAAPRVYVPELLDPTVCEASRAGFADALSTLAGLGCELQPLDDAPLAEVAGWLYETALVAERYEAIRDFFDRQSESVMEPVRGIVARGREQSAADLLEVQAKLAEARTRLNKLWDGADAPVALAVPSAPFLPTIDQMLADPVEQNRRLGRYTNFVNLLGWAAVAVPASIRADGLPFGITLIGPAGADARLAELAQRFHHAADARHALGVGATGRTLPQARPLGWPAGMPGRGEIALAVVGAHLTGLPLNWQLVERGARLLRTTRTAPHYRLHALPGTVPPKPGLVRVPGAGAEIEVEVWALPEATVGSFLALIPAPLGLGTLALEDGSTVHGFLCEAHAVAAAPDISVWGGWRAWIEGGKLLPGDTAGTQREAEAGGDAATASAGPDGAAVAGLAGAVVPGLATGGQSADAAPAPVAAVPVADELATPAAGPAPVPVPGLAPAVPDATATARANAVSAGLMLNGFILGAEAEARVRAQFELIARLYDTLEDEPLDPGDEPAPVYRP
ncbi:allophanate hydrolase [Derxia gummosa]|uniref:Allophanate hydrolase n=1 Tax=Derxia gummosa DSM 723 TaxID=1121388 RepID=A0A8B6XA78_9BURK|nr:allophanate hydrolase [Derxia gummosa]